jgi:hypothetical protein
MNNQVELELVDSLEPETLNCFCGGANDFPLEYQDFYVKAVTSYSLDFKYSSALVFRLIGISETKEAESSIYLVIDGRKLSYKGQAKTQAEAYKLGCLILKQNFPIKISHIANLWEEQEITGITLCGLSPEQFKESGELLVSEDDISDELYFCKECCKGYNWELMRRQLDGTTLNVELSRKEND